MNCGSWVRIDLINELLNRLSTNLSFKSHIMKECTSTQDIAKDLALSGAPEGTLIICESMSEGKGRRGRSWIASLGGLWLTLVLRPSRTDGLQLLSLLTGLSVAEALEEALGIEVGIKWPNDVLIKGKKVAGVLVDAATGSEGSTYALLGIGINTNNELPPDLIGNAVTLSEVISDCVNNYAILELLLKRLDINYQLYLRRKDNMLLNAWSLRDFLRGKPVTIYFPNNFFIRGLAIGIDIEGALKVRSNNKVLKVFAGEVVHVR